MKEQFQHTFTNSFCLWFDHFLLKNGESFTNKTGQLVNYSDERLDDRYKVFGSKHKQWVSDSSILGASVPSGMSVNGLFKGNTINNNIDFENGRFLTTNYSESAIVTGSFAQKDFNVYFTNETEEDLVLENTFKTNSSLPSNSGNYLEPYDQTIPAAFLSTQGLQNKAFSFGGEQETSVMAKAIFVSDNPYLLDGALSIFADSQDEVFSSIPMSESPYNELGGLKDGVYSYEALSNKHGNLRQKFYIDNVITSKLTDTARKRIDHDFYVGFVDFVIKQHRFRLS